MKKFIKAVAFVIAFVATFGLLGRLTNTHLFERKKKADTETEQEHELQWVAIDHIEVGKTYKWRNKFEGFVFHSYSAPEFECHFVAKDSFDSEQGLEGYHFNFVPMGVDCIRIQDDSYEDVDMLYYVDGFNYEYITFLAEPNGNPSAIDWVISNLLEQN